MSAYRELLDRYVELYNAGDLDGVIDLYADDAVQGMPEGIFQGPSAIHDRLARELEAIPNGTVLPPTGKRSRCGGWRSCGSGPTEDRPQHPVLRQPGRRGAARPRPGVRDRVIGP